MSPANSHSGRLVLILAGLAACSAAACSAPPEASRKGLITGSFLSETEIQRVADLMARDMVREPIFHDSQRPPRLAFVKIENDTNQYFFSDARAAYMERMRTRLQEALGPRIRFVDPQVEETLQAQLAHWHPAEEDAGDQARGHRQPHGVDYLLAAQFASLDKVVPVADRRGNVRNQKIIVLQMTFSLVDAETGEIAWQNDVASAAAFTTRDFQD